MDTDCLILWKQIEQRKERIVQSIERLSPGGQMTKRDGRAWSPNMLLEHLVLAEEQQLHEVEQGQASKFEANKTTNNFLYKMITFVLRKGIRVPVPNGMEPAGSTPTKDLVVRWNECRAKLLTIVEPLDKDQPISKHAQLGWLTLFQILTITDLHLNYHERDLTQRR